MNLQKWFFTLNRILYAIMVYLEWSALRNAINTIPTSCVQYGEMGTSILYYILFMTAFLVGDALYFALGWPFFTLGMDPASIVYNFVAVVCQVGIASGVVDPVTKLCGNYAEIFNSMTSRALWPALVHLLTAIIFQCIMPDKEAIPAHKAKRTHRHKR